jgi:hypothetical protein
MVTFLQPPSAALLVGTMTAGAGVISVAAGFLAPERCGTGLRLRKLLFAGNG